MAAEITRLRASIRSDRQLTVSGTVAARARRLGHGGRRATCKVDQALHRAARPEHARSSATTSWCAARPGRSRAPKRTCFRRKRQSLPGSSSHCVREHRPGRRLPRAGHGHRHALARHAGPVAGSRSRRRGWWAPSAPRGGEYRAYGQRLDIERGIVRFTGAVDNPALDILAIRPNMLQRVGVQVTGNALAPYVRLYAEPDMPDAEKLSWLVTGRASAGSGAEAALVQQAALALLASRSGGSKRGMAGIARPGRAVVPRARPRGPGGHPGQALRPQLLRGLRAQPVGRAGHAVHFLRPDAPHHGARRSRRAHRAGPDLHVRVRLTRPVPAARHRGLRAAEAGSSRVSTRGCRATSRNSPCRSSGSTRRVSRPRRRWRRWRPSRPAAR